MYVCEEPNLDSGTVAMEGGGIAVCTLGLLEAPALTATTKLL